MKSNSTKKKVYDIKNCGKRNRFLVRSKEGYMLAHNCLELSMGYQGGVKAFLTSALKFGIDLEELADIAYPTIPPLILREAERWYHSTKDHYGLSEKAFITCDSLKRMWRNANPNIVTFWNALHGCSMYAICDPNTIYECDHLKIIREGAWLRIMMPSGRSLCYPGAKIIDDQLTYMGVNSYTRKWERLKTYGGKLAENITQALSRDVMAANMPRIDNIGYEIILTVHDEVLTETPDKPHYNAEQLSELLSTTPDWADEWLPLNASGFEAYRYRKD